MASEHHYETTYERVRHDGVVEIEINVRINYAYRAEEPATSVNPASAAEIEVISVEETTGLIHPKWTDARSAVREWAEAWAIDNEDMLVEAAELDLAKERDRANDAWFDARKEARHVRS